MKSFNPAKGYGFIERGPYAWNTVASQQSQVELGFRFYDGFRSHYAGFRFQDPRIMHCKVKNVNTTEMSSSDGDSGSTKQSEA